MNEINLLPGQKLRIGLNNGKTMYSSQVQDISKNGTILIDTPVYSGHLVPVRIGSIVQIIYFTKQGLFTFYAKVLNRFSGKLALLEIMPISSVERLQRRQYFRLEKVIPFTYTISGGEEDKVYKGLIQDISGGGLRCKVDKKLEVGTIINCVFTLDQEITVSGKVVRYEELLEKGYEIGICYVDISEKVREKIISYIFEEQRKSRQKGIE
ncbi:flagellar brake protein [Thermoanaerobacter sp. CM-CNRG TB177]|jgi:c-di-GMP-binding flagellar brake protein YcgR|uniref:flagellar brake protein n=1 Tax=unclassified Thermoanaerobacter TaxID=2636821 RepID=UPI0000E1DF6E|nr:MULTISPECIES: flagellar brake protein [unclassified Thermoanaerobacter]KUK34651.1 MAG: Type IV pilus assembly PilZ [Caldanaerobacter subterraneus]HAA81453.1 flagellar brake protein [Thermoanaerobacter sp.]ABY92956.1 type IV pilus assembly PilZ [Thermoanaerobacter sp. X514]MBT1280026.1 flagellar brake protein [Thermoanaerobacter sp. CM-CNRG TB177]HCD10236.1 flagellar brake protein [Thermoanaerobacter sp.]